MLITIFKKNFIIDVAHVPKYGSATEKNLTV